MGYPKKHRGRRKIGSKKRRARKYTQKIGTSLSCFSNWNWLWRSCARNNESM